MWRAHCRRPGAAAAGQVMLCGPVSTGRRRPRRRRRLIACRLSKNAFIGRARSSLPEPEAKFDIDGLPCLRAHGANARMLDIPAPLRFFAEFKVENPHPCLSRPDFLGGDSDAGAPPRAQKQVWRPRYANFLWTVSIRIALLQSGGPADLVRYSGLHA